MDEELLEIRNGMRRSVERAAVKRGLIDAIGDLVEAHMMKYGLLPAEEMDANAERR